MVGTIRMPEPLTQAHTLVTDLVDVDLMYGDQDLASASLFAGGFINFGYWKRLKTQPRISRRTRILSSKNLYKEVFDVLDVHTTDTVLEVGCGLGNGCVLLHKEYSPASVIGVDASDRQIQRALSKHASYLQNHMDGMRFMVSPAEEIPLSKESMTKIFSLEALQHFASIDGFLKGTSEILKPQGKLVIATFFFKTAPSRDFMKRFPNFSCGVDKVVTLKGLTDSLAQQGFTDMRYSSIGEYVWEGFDRWIAQTDYKDTWDKHWIWAYQEGWLDYYIFEACKK